MDPELEASKREKPNDTLLFSLVWELGLHVYKRTICVQRSKEDIRSVTGVTNDCEPACVC